MAKQVNNVAETGDLNKPRSVSMDDHDWNLIKANAAAAGVSVSEYVRLAATIEPHPVRIPPVPSVDTETVLAGLGRRIAERAETVGMAPDVWLRGLVELTLDRPIAPSKVASKTMRVPSTKHLERDPRSRFASLTHAPADAPNVKWKMGEEPGPPAWMTAPTTKPGMTRDQALGAGMEAARLFMGGKAA